MSGEKKIAFLKAHLGELSPAVLQQRKRDILAEKNRRHAEASAQAKGSGERPTGQSDERTTRLCPIGGRGGDCGLPEGPSKPHWAIAKPSSWTRPIQAVRWNLSLGARATVRSRVRASACTGKGYLRPRNGCKIHSFNGPTSRVKRPATQLR
jgi:hypothetical protein